MAVCDEPEFAQEKIALRPLVIRAAGASLGQTRIRQRLEPQRGDPLGQIVKLKLVGVVLARVATGKNGLILEQLQPADARLHFCGDDGLPRYGGRPFFVEPSLILGVVDRERRELFANLFLDRFLFDFLLRREQRQLRFGRVVHERHQLVVRPVRYRVELVRVTLRTAQREAKPRGAGGVDAIDHRVESELKRIDAALLVDHRVAMKTSGHALRQCGARQHVAGDLFDGELIERHVVVDGADYPVSPRPDGSRAILLVAVRVGITCEVEP